jgi:hypothetical protein
MIGCVKSMMKQNSKCTGIVLINEHVGVLCVHTKSFIDSQMKCDQGLIPESCFCGSRSESFIASRTVYYC